MIHIDGLPGARAPALIMLRSRPSTVAPRSLTPAPQAVLILIMSACRMPAEASCCPAGGRYATIDAPFRRSPPTMELVVPAAEKLAPAPTARQAQRGEFEANKLRKRLRRLV